MQKILAYFSFLYLKHQCHPLSDIFIWFHDDSKYKTEVSTSTSLKFGRIRPLCVAWPPFQKELNRLLNTAVLLLGIEPFPIATSHHTIFLQMNDPHHLANHMPASPDRFSGYPLSLLTIYFDGGANRDVMERNDNEMVWFFRKIISCLICNFLAWLV